MQTTSRPLSGFWYLAPSLLLFWLLAVTGACRSYSPVPMMDMWNGYLGFFLNVNQGDWSAWWAQHNEHRMLMGRMLFWLDIKYFEGAGYFLLAMNYIFVLLGCALFLWALRRSSAPQHRLWAAFIALWMVSWSQSENLTWAFQGPFFMVFLLPLAAFLWLQKAAEPGPHSTAYFVMACLAGLMSLGTMANALIVLPLMMALGAYTKLAWQRLAWVAVLWIIGMALYLIGYQSPPGHTPVLAGLIAHPLAAAEFFLLFLGSPIAHAAQATTAGYVGGGLFIVAFTTLVGGVCRNKARAGVESALLVFVAYVSASALATAGGRAAFGVEYALSSRYVTPALWAWAALMAAAAPRLPRRILSREAPIWLPLLLASLLMLPMQLRALQHHVEPLFERHVAALALELGVNDRKQISHVFPYIDDARAIAKKASALNLSIFGSPKLKDAKQRIGSKEDLSLIPKNKCLGNIDQFTYIPMDSDFMGVMGWMISEPSLGGERPILFVGGSGRVVGYALKGGLREDVVQQVSPDGLLSGFKGYVRVSALEEAMTVWQTGSACSMVLPRLRTFPNQVNPSQSPRPADRPANEIKQ